MSRRLFLSGLVATVVLLAAPGLAQALFTQVTVNPSQIPAGVNTTITVIVGVTDPTAFVPQSAQLERLRADGGWDPLGKIDLEGQSGNVFTFTKTVNEPAARKKVYRVAAAFKKEGREYTPVFQVAVGQTVVPSNQDVVVPGPSGSGLSVTVPANSLTGPALVGISPAPPESISAPSSLERVATVDLVFVPASPLDGPKLTAPLILSVPAPAGTPAGAHFDFVVEGLGDSPTGGLTKQLFPVDEGIVSGGQIVSNTTNPVLPGFFGGGVVGVLLVPGSGYVIGRVVDGSDASRHGVRLRDTTTNEAWFSDVNGNFIVRVAQASNDYVIEAIDGFRCVRLSPSLTGNLTNTTDGTNTTISGQIHKTLTNPIVLATDNSGSPTRDGIRNGGFEVGAPTKCWASLTSGQLIQSGASAYRDAFNFTPAITIDPSEGNWMAALTSTSSTIEQTFLLPTLYDGTPASDFKKFRFDYVFACTGTCPAPASNNIGLQADILPASGSTPLVSLSPAPTFRQFNGQLGWRTGEIDVRSIAAGTQVRIRFTVTGAAANTVALIDNVRFDTVVVTANIITGATTTEPDVRQHIRDANEILSQAGVNVRIRRVNPSVNPLDGTCNPSSLDFFGTDGTDVTWTTQQLPPPPDLSSRSWGNRTAEVRALTCLGPRNYPSDPVSDVHVYYVNLLKDVNNSSPIYGVAVTPEDYLGESYPTPLSYNAADPFNYFNDSAILVASLSSLPATDPNRAKETPAHELGHLLLHATQAGDLVEHNAPYGNIMTSSVCLPRYGTSKCSARPILREDPAAAPPFLQESNFQLPNPPPRPACPVTCPR